MSKKTLYLSHSQFKGKARGNSRGKTPDKRNLIDDLDMTDKDILLMKEAFDIMDLSKSEVISKSDLENFLISLKTDCEIGEKILKGLEDLHEINFYEFVQHVDSARGNPKTKEGCEKIFDLIGNEEGKLDFNCLQKLCRETGNNLSDEQIQEALDRIAPGKGYMTLVEFKTLMIRRTRIN